MNSFFWVRFFQHTVFSIKVLLFCGFTLLLSIELQGQPDMLIAAKQKKWGFINTAGKWIVAPKYDYVSPFSEGRAYVADNDKYGVINQNGKLVVPLTFDEIDICTEGLMGFRVDKKWGFLDTNGNVVIPPKFDFVYRFSEGLCAVVQFGADKTERLGFIDRKGNFVIGFDKNFVHRESYYYPRFKNGRAVVMMPFTGNELFNDTTQIEVVDYSTKKGIEKKLTMLELNRYYRNRFLQFADNQSTRNADVGFYYVIIDKRGKVLVSDKLFIINDLSENGFALGFGSLFNNGLMPVNNPGKVIFIDTTLFPVFYIDADHGNNFFDEITGIEFEGRVRFYNPLGLLAFKTELPDANNPDMQPMFTNGLLAWWNDDKKFGYLNTNGEWAVKPVYDYASPLFNGIGFVENAGKFALIDASGQLLTGFDFKEIMIDLCPCLK